MVQVAPSLGKQVGRAAGIAGNDGTAIEHRLNADASHAFKIGAHQRGRRLGKQALDIPGKWQEFQRVRHAQFGGELLQAGLHVLIDIADHFERIAFRFRRSKDAQRLFRTLDGGEGPRYKGDILLFGRLQDGIGRGTDGIGQADPVRMLIQPEVAEQAGRDGDNGIGTEDFPLPVAPAGEGSGMQPQIDVFADVPDVRDL